MALTISFIIKIAHFYLNNATKITYTNITLSFMRTAEKYENDFPMQKQL